MRIDYDRESDASFIYFVDEIGPGDAARTAMCELEVRNSAVILLLSEDNVLLGIEVLGASRLLPNGLLEKAEQPRLPRPHPTNPPAV